MSFVRPSRNGGKAFVAAVLAQDAAAIAERDADITRRTRLEVAKLRAQAEAEGRAAGEAAARAAMAPQEAALGQAAAALAAAAAQLTAPLAHMEHELAALVTELGFLLARHIAGAELTANPDAMQTLVTRLLAEAASERSPTQTLIIHLNPADIPSLTPHIPATAATLAPDPTITPGGARAELTTPDGDPLNKTEWDATLPGRFNTIRTSLGLPDTTGSTGA